MWLLSNDLSSILMKLKRSYFPHKHYDTVQFKLVIGWQFEHDFSLCLMEESTLIQTTNLMQVKHFLAQK